MSCGSLGYPRLTLHSNVGFYVNLDYYPHFSRVVCPTGERWYPDWDDRPKFSTSVLIPIRQGLGETRTTCPSLGPTSSAPPSRLNVRWVYKSTTRRSYAAVTLKAARRCLCLVAQRSSSKAQLNAHPAVTFSLPTKRRANTSPIA